LARAFCALGRGLGRVKDYSKKYGIAKGFIFGYSFYVTYKSVKTKRCKMYSLGDNFKGIHFSKQEARCMVCLLHGKSNKGVARALSLSPRTVEFYVKNMKKKLKCRTKFELIENVLDSDFQRNIELNILKI